MAADQWLAQAKGLAENPPRGSEPEPSVAPAPGAPEPTDQLARVGEPDADEFLTDRSPDRAKPAHCSGKAHRDPAIRSGVQWAVDRPEWIFGDSYEGGKLVELTATEREAEWEKLSAWQKGVEERTREILGDEGQEDVLADLWYLRQPDIQDKLVKVARHERSLTRQLDCTRKLLHFVQMAAEDATPVGAKEQ